MTRTELLVVLGLLLVLAAVGVGPISGYFAKNRLNRAVESAHTLSTLLSQYATDNNGVYPVGEGTPSAGKSVGIARNLLENNYTPNASIFAVGSTRSYAGTTPDYADLAPANLSWDFTAGATATTGITSSAPDLLPVVFTTSQAVTYAAASITLSGQGPLGDQGLIVAYKNQAARFIPSAPSANGPVCAGFLAPDFKATDTYTQIKP